MARRVRSDDEAAPRRGSDADRGMDQAATDEPLSRALAAAVVPWFIGARRDLPWRRTRDPYAVWISEVMLQQTRVDTVAPRWLRWMARFPTTAALAEAPLDDVLAEWAGLGYYARARNLSAAARAIAERHDGRFPEDEDAVRALPGVGAYTAGAILSIAFGQPAPILDGNVERVLSRVFRVEGDPARGETKRRLWRLAALVVSGGGGREVSGLPFPSAVNQGLMELGAMVCAPRKPACLTCPVATMCGARREGDPERFPAPSRKARVLAVDLASVAVARGGKLLLCQRPADGLWGGLWELVSGEVHDAEAPLAAARRVLSERTGLDPIGLAPLDERARSRGVFTHVLSHRRIRFHTFTAESPRGRVKLTGYDHSRWVGPAEAEGLGISRATSIQLRALAPRA